MENTDKNNMSRTAHTVMNCCHHKLLIVLFLLVTVVYTDGQECNVDAIPDCLSQIVNITHPITSLPLADTNHTSQLCGRQRDLFYGCYADLAAVCSTHLLYALKGMNDTLNYLCHQDRINILSDEGQCLAMVLQSESISRCQLSVYEHVLGSREDMTSDVCSHVVDFLTCVRWVTWSHCGKMAAELLHDINKIALGGVITELSCSIMGDDNPSGLTMTYVLKAQYWWSGPTPVMMRVFGDPKDWLSSTLEDGAFSSRTAVISSTGGLVNFGYVAADYWHNKLLWIHKDGKTINELPLYFTGTITSQVIFGALSNDVRGLAVDWVSQNVYVADGGFQWISQISYKPGYVGHHKVILDTEVTPSSIITHPRKGRIYWSDSSRGSVESITVAGEDRVTVKSSITRPTALAMDYPTDTLYWVWDNKHVSYCTVDGTGCGDLFSKPNAIFVDFDIYEGFLFMASQSDDLYIYNLTSSDFLGEIDYKADRTLHRSIGIAVSAPDKQYPFDNPCYFDNGGCAHVCVQEQDHEEGRTCICSLGYTLGTDGISCVTTPFIDDFLLVADVHAHDIYMLHIKSSEIQAVPIPSDSEPEALAFDKDTNSVIWLDAKESYRIMRTSLNGSFSETLVDFHSDRIMELTYDTHSKTLYCTKYSRGQIVKIDTTSDTPTPVVVISTHTPVDVALDVGTRTMYWSTLGGMFNSPPPAIHTANMVDGSNKQLFLTSGMMYPMGLTIDTKERMLFWCDLYSGKVERVGLDGQRRQVLISRSGSKFYSIALDELYIYIADADSRNLLRYNRETQAVSNFGPPEFQKAVSVRLYKSNIESYIHPTTTHAPTTTSTVQITTTTTITATSTTTMEATTTTTPSTITSSDTTTESTTEVMWEFSTITPSTTTTTPLTTASSIAPSTTENIPTTEAVTTIETTTTQATESATADINTTQSPSSPTTPVATTEEITSNPDSTPETSTTEDVTVIKTSNHRTTTTTATTIITTTQTNTTLFPLPEITTTTKSPSPRLAPLSTTPPPPLTTTAASTIMTPPTTTATTTMTTTTTTLPSQGSAPLSTTPTKTTTTTTPPQKPPKLSTTTATTPMTTTTTTKSTPRTTTSTYINFTVQLSEAEATKSKGLGGGAVAGIVIAFILLTVAVAGAVWYVRTKGPVRIFSRMTSRYARADDTVVLEDAPTPADDNISVSDLWMWSAGSTNC